MTNQITKLLDAAEPDAWQSAGKIFGNPKLAEMYGGEVTQLYSRATVEKLMRQVLRKAAEVCDHQYEKDKAHQAAGGQDNSDGYVTGYKDGCGDCGHELRRMAEEASKDAGEE